MQESMQQKYLVQKGVQKLLPSSEENWISKRNEKSGHSEVVQISSF